MMKYLKGSTLKREAASVLMLWLVGISTYVILTSGDAVKVQILEAFILPVGVLFAGAFGLDWISKQTTIAGPPMTEAGASPPTPPDTVTVAVEGELMPPTTTVAKG
jgi:hypothetical protein